MPELGVNKVVLIGRSGGNAKLKFTAGGRSVASFSLAVNESFKTRDGEKNDRVESRRPLPYVQCCHSHWHRDPRPSRLSRIAPRSHSICSNRRNGTIIRKRAAPRNR